MPQRRSFLALALRLEAASLVGDCLVAMIILCVRVAVVRRSAGVGAPPGAASFHISVGQVMPLAGAGKTEKFGSIGNNARAEGHACQEKSGNGDIEKLVPFMQFPRLTLVCFAGLVAPTAADVGDPPNRPVVIRRDLP